MAPISPPTDRVVAVLNALADRPTSPMTISELARSQDISVATCHAIVASLAASGFLVRTGPNKRYALGPRAMAVGQAAQLGMVPSATASSLLDELSDELGYPCTLRTKVGSRIIVLDNTGDEGRGGNIQIGDHYTFAPPFGLSFVLWGSESTRQEWMARAPAPPPLQELDRLDALASSSRRRGYAVHELLSETRRQLHAALQAATSEELHDEPIRSLLAEVLKTMWVGAFVLDDLGPGTALNVSSLSAPVGGDDGYARWIVELHVNDRLASVRKAETLGKRLSRTAAAITRSARSFAS